MLEKGFFQMKKLRLFLSLALFACFIFASLIFLQAQGRPPGSEGPRFVPLFTAVGAVAYGADAIAPQAARYRVVAVNPLIMVDGGVGIGDRIFIDAFPDKVYMAAVDRINKDINGVLAVRGRIEGLPGSYFLISIDGERALGVLSVLEQSREFEILPVAGLEVHVIQEINPKLRIVLEDGPPLIPPSAGPTTSFPPISSSPGPEAATVRIDVMIVYTPAARDWAAGTGGINNVINQAVEKGQIALDNSGVEITERLVRSSLIDYTESGSSTTDLNRLTNTSDGFMDDVHTWRNTYGADLVQLFSRVEDTGGLGWLLNTTAGLPAWAFSLARVQQAGTTSYTSIHEFGHNMGCHHRKDQATQPGPGLFSYSAGWRWLGNDGNRYCSVMSYGDSWNGNSVNRVAYFSNPNVSHLGAATGHAADGDNARTLREIKSVISGYRSETGTNTLTISAGTGGTTNPAPGTHTYTTDSTVTVTALPNTHYKFNNWTGNASGSQNPISILMDRDKSITANFLRLIYAPSNASGRKVLNRSLSQAEYINILTWENNANNVNIASYKIYLVEGSQKTEVASLAADQTTYTYWIRNMSRDKEYTYQIVAVNNEPREGDPATVVVK
jgi:hypothetical protein